MIRRVFSCVAVFLLLPLVTFSEEALSLEAAVNTAVKNNYEIKRQRIALELAQAQYRQVKGAFDVEVGAEAGYTMSQQPVDHDDPNYVVDTGYDADRNLITVYADNVLNQQTSGSLFIQKLFGFGLSSKLSYSISRQKTAPDYTYSDGFPASAQLDETEARNYGTVSLELSLPLFKSFKNSIAALQLESAQDYIGQMEATLTDTISKTVVSVSKAYYSYFLAYNYLELVRGLQTRIEERNSSMDSLIRAGVRSKNDLLALQVNALENQRTVENANVQYLASKTELMTLLGLSDSVSLAPPSKDAFPSLSAGQELAPDPLAIDKAFLEKIIEKRPDMIALKKSLAASEARLRIAQVDALPDAALGFAVGATGAAYGNDTNSFFGAGTKNVRGADISGKLSVRASLGNNAKAGVRAEARAQYDALVADYDNAVQTLSLQVRHAADKVAVYRKAMQNADDVLALQKNLYENEQKRFTAGLITVDNLLSQDERYISAENSYYQVLINYLLSVLEYKYYVAEIL